MKLNLYNYEPERTFSQKDLIGLQNYSQDEIYQILSLALKLKQQQKDGETHTLLKGKTLGMIFTKSSTRTRVSFEVGMYQLGGTALYLSLIHISEPTRRTPI